MSISNIKKYSYLDVYQIRNNILVVNLIFPFIFIKIWLYCHWQLK